MDMFRDYNLCTDEGLTAIYNEANGLDPKRHNPITTERIFAAMRGAIAAERDACAKACEHLWQEEATAAMNGMQEPKYHDAIECAYAIRLRSNAQVEGAEGCLQPQAPSRTPGSAD